MAQPVTQGRVRRVAGRLLACLAVILVAAVIPSIMGRGTAGSFSLPHAAAYYELIFRKNFLGLVFPLLCAVPYVLWFCVIKSRRFLTYTRTRRPVRRTLARHLAANAAFASVTFLLVGLIPQMFISVDSTYRYRPESSMLTTPEQIRAAELTSNVFSGFLASGPWGLAVAYSVWLAVNAALYATIALCLTLVMRRWVIAVSVPWVGQLGLTLVMAYLGLELWSPGLIVPFNLTSMPLANLAVPLGLVTLVAGGLVAWVMANADRLESLQ